MKSGFVRIPAYMADPEPPPEPIPFPIKIVTEPPPRPSSTDPAPQDADAPSSSKRFDEFYPAWDGFLLKQPQRATKTSRAAHQIESEKREVEESSGDGLQSERNVAQSWQQAADECRAKVAAIVEECTRLNQKYRDALFDLETNLNCLQSLTGRYPTAVDKIDVPPWIKRVEDIFDDPQFFIDGATPTDVHQGSGGDCWFLASLMAVTAKKDLIDKLCIARDEEVGVYGFVFYRDGEWIYEVIDDKLYLRVGDDDDLKVVRDWNLEKKQGMPLKYEDEKLKDVLQKGGEALYFSHCKSNETWLPLIEKAYAKAHGDYSSIEGGFASEGIEDLTGGVAVVLNPEDIMNKERFWRDQLAQVNKKYLFGGGSRPADTKGFIGSHAYAVLEAWEEGDLKLLKLRNPWGEKEWEGDWSDGSKLWTADMMIKLKHTFGDDGVFWIDYKDFLKHFPSINRVRLFDESWTVGQQWTCVSVPWTVDYLDTKFQFTITEQGPVVIVLAQPDDRYFYGLRGRFFYSMHFRVYKNNNDEQWIVRSMHNSGNETVFTRSVSAEIEDLEPGTYNVVFKVTAIRSPTASTAEEAILKHAVQRKEKLLHVGRRFDYAQMKGNLRAMEETVRKQRKRLRKENRKAGFKKAREFNLQERERARRRRQRVDDAMREKRKAFERKQRERARYRRQRALQLRENESTRAHQGATPEENATDKPSKELTPNSSENATKPTENDRATEPNLPELSSDTQPPTQTNSNLAPRPQQVEHQTRALAAHLSELALHDKPRRPRNARANRPPDDSDSDSEGRHNQEEDEEEDNYDSPIEPPEELDDDDFEWDSEIDGPVSWSSKDEEMRQQRTNSHTKYDIFGDDPWNALCVLGLRVYSKSADLKVKVVKADSGS